MHIGQFRPSYKMKVETNQTQKLVFFIVSLIICLFVSSQNIYPQSNDDCLMCHEDQSLTTEKNGKEVSLFVNKNVLANSTHGKLNCVSCHVGFNPEELPHKENITPINCKSCHQDAAVKHPFHPQMLKADGISGGKDVNCKYCHGTHDVISPKSPKSKYSKANLNEFCGTCHKENFKSYSESDHAVSFKEGEASAPDCITCHKNQITFVNNKKDSLSIKIVQEKLCLSCHLDNPTIRARTTPSTGFIAAYEKSVHGAALMGGNKNAANCVDCHSAHNIKGGINSESTVSKLNIPKTCSKCHSEIAETYLQSIHGVSAMKGNKEAPVCTDCHGEHDILRADDPEAPVSYKNVSSKVCSPCHSSVKLSQKFGISANRYKTFEDSYHGLALRGGSVEVANCVSCHGVHNIKPSSDSTSTINKANLIKTCGTCHPGANANFAVGKIHVNIKDKSQEPILYWIASLYISMIVVVIGFMFLHNLIDFIKKSKIKKMKQRGLIREEKHGHALYLRMTVNERIQHIALALSFILLVITGFMLRFPDSWWVSHIRDLSEDAFEYRSILHRISAVVMVLASLYHIWYISFTQRGRHLVKDLFPKLQDVNDAIAVAKYNLGFSRIKPKLDRFSYVEKAEYWALVWGTMVMTATGVIMWFDNTFIGMFTKLGWDVARTIHYYEAWLAFLAIVVWHFYFVIFNPEMYPMNIAWLKGTLTEEEMAEEHGRELDRIKKSRVEELGDEDDMDKIINGSDTPDSN